MCGRWKRSESQHAQASYSKCTPKHRFFDHLMAKSEDDDGFVHHPSFVDVEDEDAPPAWVTPEARIFQSVTDTSTMLPDRASVPPRDPLPAPLAIEQWERLLRTADSIDWPIPLPDDLIEGATLEKARL